MNNKIKIAVSLFLACLLSGCIGWLDNDHFYERTVNDWMSIEYWAVDNIYSSDYIKLSFSNNLEKKKGERINFGSGTFMIKRPILGTCAQIIYNNEFVLAKQKYIPDGTDSTYYKLMPTFSDDNVTPIGYSIDTITEAKFNSLVDSCSDCKELTADKIRQLDYELDHGGFPTKTVLFFGLIIVFLYFRYRRKKKKYKSNSF